MVIRRQRRWRRDRRPKVSNFLNTSQIGTRTSRRNNRIMCQNTCIFLLMFFRYDLFKLSHTHSSLRHFLMLQLLRATTPMPTTTARTTRTTTRTASSSTATTIITTPRGMLFLSH
ncbi:hypothetical protein Hanom_Chr10g00938841 [Helianthus anomalus]